MLKPGDLVDRRYRIERQLGQGGMGSVYAATHVGTGRRIALKVILSESGLIAPEVIERFQREARSAGSLETPHVVHIIDTGVDAERGVPFMTMELLRGEDFADLVGRAEGPVPWQTAVKIVAQACIGLGRAHQAGVVHRDIKSANIYLAFGDGGDVIVKLLDFGIAKVRGDGALDPQSAALTRTGSLLGSPLYMSPEQILGAKNVDARADLWSLGVVLYEALAGRTPNHDVDSLGRLVIAICHQPAAPIQSFAPWVPPALAEIVHKALRIPAAERFQTAEDFYQALLPFCDGSHNLTSGDLHGMTGEERASIAVRARKSSPSLELSPTMAGPAFAPGTGNAPIRGATTTSPVMSSPPAVLAASQEAPQRGGLLAGALVGLLSLGGIGAALIYMNVTRSHPQVAADAGTSVVATRPDTSDSVQTPEPAPALSSELAVVPDAGPAARRASHAALPTMKPSASAPAPVAAPAAPVPAPRPGPSPAPAMSFKNGFD